MMADLGKQLESWQGDGSKRVLFSVLFSDIGKQFYAKHGWKPFPSAHVSIPTTSSVRGGLPSVTYLRTADLAPLCKLDEMLLRRRHASGTKHTQIAVVPDTATMGWHHAREEFVANELFGRPPEIKGATVGEAGARVWCYWTRVWTNPHEEAPNTLHILRLVIEDETYSDFAPATEQDSQTVQSIAALFAAAQQEAGQWGMKQVQIWNPTSATLAAAQMLHSDAKIEHREKESIASLRWHGTGSHEDVDWICNEKYGWC